MNKEFIPYEQALELKELGFNERCINHYSEHNGESLLHLMSTTPIKNESFITYKGCAAPLYQQAFRWFREKGYRFTLSSDYENGIYYFDVWKSNQFMFETDYIYNTYEEAELACLKKLIEIVKTYNQNK